MFCSPNKNGQNKTCFTTQSLRKIAKSYNEENPQQKIASVNRKSKIELWQNIQNRLKNKCNSEICWIKQNFVKNLNDPEIEQFTFRPEMPSNWTKNRYTWLSTIDIQEVMKQYEKKFKDFHFLGPVPYDCPYGITCELTTITPVKLIRARINKLGIIYNLDYHNEPGSHWVAVFIDLLGKSVEYYDSYANRPPKLINKWMEKIQKEIAEYYKQPCELKYNRRRHQYGNSECGVFSMNFIMERLNGRSLEEISKKKLTDEQMNRLRNILYRPMNSIPNFFI
jgi:hypothetical protein